MTEFEKEVLTSLGKLQQGQSDINNHLRTLNGRVAAHELAIGELKVGQAARLGAAGANTRWMEMGKPFIWGLVIIIAYVIGNMSPEWLGLLK